MALVRMVEFEGVNSDRMNEMRNEMEGQEQPEGMNASELIVLHDPQAQKSVVLVFFENEDDYRKGDEILNAMPASDTPGRRASVAKYDLAHRQTM
jgi:hypothetical protein